MICRKKTFTIVWAIYFDPHCLISILLTHKKLCERGVCTVPVFQHQMWHDKIKQMFLFNAVNCTIVFIFPQFVLGTSTHLSLLQTRKQIRFLSAVLVLINRVEYFLYKTYLGKSPLYYYHDKAFLLKCCELQVFYNNNFLLF